MLEVLARVGKVAERGPLAIVGGPRQHSEISLEMKVYRDVDSYTLKPDHQKTTNPKLLKNAKNNNLLKTQKVLNTGI